MLLTDWYNVLTGKAYLPLSRQDCSLEVNERNQGTDCEWTLLWYEYCSSKNQRQILMSYKCANQSEGWCRSKDNLVNAAVLDEQSVQVQCQSQSPDTAFLRNHRHLTDQDMESVPLASHHKYGFQSDSANLPL